MHVDYFWKDIRFTDEELILVAKKVGKLSRYYERLKDEGSRIRVEAERRDTKKSRDQVKVKIIVHLPKKTFSVESRKDTALFAIDSCVEKLEEDIKAYKEMHTGKGKARLAARQKE